MKAIRTMSIIGLVFASLGIISFYMFDYSSYVEDAEAVAGWLIIVSVWLIAQSIVGIVKTKEIK